MSGQFSCQSCGKNSTSARFYKSLLELTWKCKSCEHVSTVSIFKERGY